MHAYVSSTTESTEKDIVNDGQINFDQNTKSVKIVISSQQNRSIGLWVSSFPGWTDDFANSWSDFGNSSCSVDGDPLVASGWRDGKQKKDEGAILLRVAT